MSGRVAAIWASFAERVLPMRAGSVQKRETKRSFYAGAAAMLEIVSNLSAELSEEDACRELAAVEAELLDFMADVERGRA